MLSEDITAKLFFFVFEGNIDGWPKICTLNQLISSTYVSFCARNLYGFKLLKV